MNLRAWALAPLAAVLAGAAPAPSQTDLRASADRVRAHVEFLADDLLEGRGTGTRGHELAALYVASQFRSLGLRPAGNGGSWYQRVPFRRAFHEGTPVVTLTSGGKTTSLRWGGDVAVRPSLTQRQRTLRSGLVFAGYGIADPALGIDDFRGLDVRGRTVVVFAGTPAGLNSEVAAHLGSQKPQMAAAAGATRTPALSHMLRVVGATPTRLTCAAGRIAPGTVSSRVYAAAWPTTAPPSSATSDRSGSNTEPSTSCGSFED